MSDNEFYDDGQRIGPHDKRVIPDAPDLPSIAAREEAAVSDWLASMRWRYLTDAGFHAAVEVIARERWDHEIESRHATLLAALAESRERLEGVERERDILLETQRHYDQALAAYRATTTPAKEES